MKPALQPQTSPDTPDPRTLFALGELITIVRRLGDRLTDVARFLHDHDGLSVAERGVLLMLRGKGPQTIPQLAVRKGVSRQSVRQTLLPLIARGIVGWQDNPVHRRSHLAALTPEGRQLMQRVMTREGEFVRELARRLDHDELAAAVDLLRRIDSHLVDGNAPESPERGPTT